MNGCRDGSNTVTKRYYPQGMQIGTTNYYYTKDHLGSIREMTDGNGVVHARYDYDPRGRLTKVQGDSDSDFTYAGYCLLRWLCVSGNPHKLLRAGHCAVLFLYNFYSLAASIVGELAARAAVDCGQSVQWIPFKGPRAITGKIPIR